MSASVSLGAAWVELVSTALLGTDRRGGGGGPTDDSPIHPLAPFARAADPAVALLDQVAAAHAARRAGAQPAAVGERLPPVAACPRSACPSPAARRLGVLLAGRHGDLLPEALALLAEGGYALPPEHLGALMERTRAEPDVRALVVRAAGPILPWLAETLPQLGWATAPVVGLGAGTTGASTADEVDTVWSRGSISDRVALLRQLRATDPGAARDRLAKTLPKERAEHRAALLRALDEGLGPDDERLLERALDDRSAGVRAASVALLRRLDRSRWSDRMATRARGLVRIAAVAGSGRLDVVLVAPLPAAWERDGIDAAAPRGVSIGVHALRQVVAATPLTAWQPLGAPEVLVTMATEHELGPVLLAAWAEAAAAQGDALWARALVAEAELPALVGVLDPLDLSEAAARVAVSEQVLTPFGLAVLGAVPRPWSEGLARAVTDAVVGLFVERRVGRHHAPILRRLARLLPPPLLEPIAEELSILGLAPPLDGVRDDLCDLLGFRAAMVRELSAGVVA